MVVVVVVELGLEVGLGLGTTTFWVVSFGGEETGGTLIAGYRLIR